MREAGERSRGYADFDHWPPNPSLADLERAKLLMLHLQSLEKLQPLSVECRGNDDPPDCWATMADGKKSESS